MTTTDGGTEGGVPTDTRVTEGGTEDGGDGSMTPVVMSIQVTPMTAMVGVGGMTRFTATATLSNMMTQDVTTMATWASSDPTKATIDMTGQATGVANGPTMITATFGGMTSAAATLTVAAPMVTSIALDPIDVMAMAGGMPTQITARGTFSDGMTRDINGEMGITWMSSNPMVATVDAMGMVTPVAMGTARITASLGGVTSGSPTIVTVTANQMIRSIALDPPMAMLAAGTTQRFTVTATFADGRTGDVTSMAMFAINNMNATAGMGADASLITARMAGMATVTATVGTQMATANLTITAPALRSIAIEPGTAIVGAGTTQQFRAVGTFADGSSSELTTGVMWSSGTPATATISATGLVTGVAAAAAPVTITAAFTPMGGMPVMGSATVLVTDSPIRMLSATLEPVGNIAIGGRAQIRVQGTFADGMSRDLTTQPGTGFMSSAGSTAAVSATGQVTGVAAGMATITVSYMGQMATVPVTVAGTLVTGIDITPATPGTLALGSTQAFTATARLSDMTTRDVTADPNLTFASSNTMIATISNAAGATRGVATAARVGSTNITATYTPPMGMGMPVTSTPIPLAVGNAVVTGIDVTSASATTPAGFSVRFTATGRFSDGTTADLTQDARVSWSSGTPATATISNLGTTKGIAQGVMASATPVVITATFNSGAMGAMPILGTRNLTVSAVTLTAIDITPDDVRVGINTTRQYTATGVFSDGTSTNITEDVNWAVAPGFTGGAVSSLPGTRGLFTAGAAPVARTVGAIRATKVIGTSTVEGRATTTVVGDFVLTSIRLRQGGLDLPVAGRNFYVPQGATVGLRAFGTFSDMRTSEEREITADAMSTWNTSVPANITVSNAAATKGQITAVVRAAGAAASSQVSVTYAGFTSPVLTVIAGGTNCDVTTLSLTTDDRQIPGSAATMTLPANPAVNRPAANMAFNNVGRGGTRTVYTWGNFAGAGCSNPAPINLTESGNVTYSSSAMANAGVSNAAGTRGLVTVPTTAPVTPAGGTGSDITATFRTVQSQFQVVVTNACINTLSITQLGGTRALPVGVASTFVISAALADGTNVTTTDNSLPLNSVDITSTGLGMMGVGFPVLAGPQVGGQWLPGTFLASNSGMATVRAVPRTGGTFAACNTMMPPSATAMLTVNTATVTGVTINPAMSTIAAGTFLDGFRVNAAFSDMTTFDVTNVASWTSSRTEITFPPFGATVPARFGSPARRIAVAAGATGNGTATASFAQGGTSQSGVTNIVFGGGAPTALTAINSLSSANCARTNQFGAYPVGTDIQIETRGTLSTGGANQIIPHAQLTYSVSDPMRASISATGVLSFNLAGTVTVTARLTSNPSISFTSPAFTAVDSALASISTVPAAGFTIPVGTMQQFTVTGDFGMGSTACPIAQTRGITWSALPTTNPGWSIGAMTGLAAATATATPGAVTVIASYMSRMATTNGSITGGCVTGIELGLPAGSSPSIASDEVLVLTPSAVLSNGMRTVLTSGVTYTSSNPFTATVSPISLSRGQVAAASPLMPGMVTITASYGGPFCAGVMAPRTVTQAVTVTDAVLRSITIACTRTNPSSGAQQGLVGGRLVAGQLANCTATGTFSNGTQQPITTPMWRATGTGMISATGVATAGSTPGTLSLEAQSGSVIGTLNIPVVGGGTPTITIGARPALPTQGAVLQINTGVVTRLVGIATYTYSAGGGPITEAYDVTEQAGWTSSQATRVDVSNSAGSKGRATGGVNPGNSTITATLGAEMGTVVIDNAEKVLVGVRTAFGNVNGSLTATVTAGARANVFVRGEYCPVGTMAGGAGCQFWDVTPIASLQVVNTAVAALETTGTQPQVRGVAPVSTAVRGTLGTFNADATLTVSPACIQLVALSSMGVNAVVAGAAGVESSSHTFTVTGTRSDGTTVVLTDPANMLQNNVFVNLQTANPGGWDTQIVAGEQFTARFPTAGMGTYRVVFNGTGSTCGNVTLTSALPATTVLASPGMLTGIAVSQVVPGAIPASIQAANTASAFRATGTYTLTAGGTTTADLTFNNQITWSTGNTAVAVPGGAISATSGTQPSYIRGVSAGSTSVNARLGNVTGTGTVSVSMATLMSLRWQWLVQDYARNNGNDGRGGPCNLGAGALTGVIGSGVPSSFILPEGGFSGRVVVNGLFSDNVGRDVTNQVTFEMDNAYGTITPAGVITTAMTAPAGTTRTTITARSSVMGVAPLLITLDLVRGALNNVIINPPAATDVPTVPGPATVGVNLGIPAPLYVVGLFGATNRAFCVTQNTSFTSADMTKATVDSAGIITGVAAGNSLITATAGSRNDTISATVAMAVPRFLELNPGTVSLAANDIGQTRALVRFSDGTQQDVSFAGAARITYFTTANTGTGGPAIFLDTVNGDFNALRAGTATIDACFHPTAAPSMACAGGLRASTADTSMVPAPAGMMGMRNYSLAVTVTP